MPIYEFECGECDARFEELVAPGTEAIPCVVCASTRTRRLMSSVSPPGRQPRGAKVRSNESMRGEREAARRDRIVESRQKRARGENPHHKKKKAK